MFAYARDAAVVVEGRFLRAVAVEFYLCAAGGYNRQVGLIEFPHDRQLGDNMAASDEIVKIIKKRIRKST